MKGFSRSARATIYGVTLTLLLSACTTGTDIGGNLTDPGTSIAASESPTVTAPTKKPPKRNNNEPKPSEEPKPEVNRIILAVRDNFVGFEWKAPGDKKWTDAQAAGGPGAFVGDIIVFKNMDKEGFDHSWVNNAANGVGEGKLFKSPVLKVGEQWEWKVTEAALQGNKQWPYKDGKVPYRNAGPLVAFER